LSAARYAKVAMKENGDEWGCKAKAKDGRELSNPQGDQILFPLVPWRGHSHASAYIIISGFSDE
jgi:hypothetical protein